MGFKINILIKSKLQVERIMLPFQFLAEMVQLINFQFQISLLK